MPPKVELLTLVAKRDSTIASLNDSFKEFYVLYQVEPLLSTPKTCIKKSNINVEVLKSSKKQLPTDLLNQCQENYKQKNQEIGDRAKANFLKCTEQFAIYQKSFAAEKPPLKHEALEAMTSAVTKMADVLSLQKNASHGLEKLSVPCTD